MPFIIDADNNITAFETMDQVRASNPPAGSASISSKAELFRAYAKRSTADLIDLWNSFAGTPGFDDLKPVKKFTDRNTGVDRIWRAIQRLAGAAKTPIESPGSVPELPEEHQAPAAARFSEEEQKAICAQNQAVGQALAATVYAPEETAALAAPKAKKPARKASAAPQAAHVAPKAARSTKEATAAKPAKEGTRTAVILGLISRKSGGTLQEIMEATGWQAHSVRGFICTLGKKGLASITSTRREDGARLYRAEQQ